MINFQEVMTKLLTPGSAAPELSGRPAIIQAGSKAQGTEDKIITYGDLHAMTARVFKAYRQAGVGAGDAVLLCSPNTPELVAAILAGWGAGATVIPVDFRLTQAEVENIARRVNTKIVYTPRF